MKQATLPLFRNQMDWPVQMLLFGLLAMLLAGAGCAVLHLAGLLKARSMPGPTT